MTVSDSIKLAASFIILGLSGTAIAQEATDDHADVILAIEEQWQAEQEGNDDWIDDSLVDNFSAWPRRSPAPQSKSSTRLWNRFFNTQGQMVEHELYFQNIAVRGDVAVAHYFYMSAFEDNDGDVEVSHGRYTDVLVRTEDGWKFLSWHGGDDE